MSSLADLAKTLDELDIDTEKRHILKDISYGLTFNESLGFKDAADFHVSQPYISWPEDLKNATDTFESPLAIAFKDVVEKGLAASTNKNGKVFIDIASLAGGWPGFFLRTHTNADDKKENLAQAFCRLVRDQIPKEATPVIRILLGMRGKSQDERPWQDELQQEFKELFWPDGKSSILHPNAEVYVGFYSPSFDAARDPQAIQDSAPAFDTLVQIIRDLVGKIRDSLLGLHADVKTIVNNALAQIGKDAVIKQLAQAAIPSISWNHAKILAVDGRTSMTGGGIFLWDYADGAAQISDLQSKVKGEAAISTHSYCDYFWQYLNRDHKTDVDSFRIHASARTTGGPTWDLTEKAPLFDRKPTIKAATSAATKPILTIAKLGDWHGEMNKLQYPVQIIDAIRDLIVNVVYRVMISKASSFGTSLIFEATVLKSVDDKSLLKSFQAAKVAPTSWASRIARCKAITSAKTHVILDAESIACFLHLREKDWKTKGEGYLKLVNEKVGLTGNDAWDGVIWPYDLLTALATFMKTIKDDEINKKQVRILLSSPVSTSKFAGWQDGARAYEMKQRIAVLGGHTLDVDKWFDARCKIKRTSGSGERYNHCKVTCVDNKLLYVGSDNSYPNYNEEHGIWIEDQAAIESWRTTCFERRWNQAVPADLKSTAQVN